MRVAPPIELEEPRRLALRELAADAATPALLAQRLRIVLRAAAGEQNKAIAQALGIGRAQVARWRAQFIAAGIAPLLSGVPRHDPGLRQRLLPLTRPRDEAAGGLGPAAQAAFAGTAETEAEAALPPAGPAGALLTRTDIAALRQPAWPAAAPKLRPPRAPRRMLDRGELVGRLVDARRRRCVLLQGQAGSGKTGALLAWRRELLALGFDVCWLSLAADDDQPARLLAYLLASLAEADLRIEREFAPPPAGPVDDAALELAAIGLAQALARHPRELVLVLDDLHHLRDERIVRFLQWLVDHGPPRLHLALATRAAPRLALDRLRLAGELAEFGPHDLRLSPAESEALLTRLLGRLPAPELQRLQAATDGWLAGLQRLAAEATARRGRGGVAAFVREPQLFSDYFARELMPSLAADDLQMLTRASICRRLSPALAAALLDRPDDAPRLARRLQALAADHAFVERLADVAGSRETEPWFRIHPLWRGVLRERLDGDAGDGGAVRRLHLAAEHWFESHGHLDEAVGHAVAAEAYDRAARLVEAGVPALLLGGELDRAAALLRALPAAVAQARDGLQRLQAFVQLYARDVSGLSRSLERLGGSTAIDDAPARYALVVLRAGLALQRDDVDSAGALLPELLQRPADVDPFLVHAGLSLVAWLATVRGDDERALAAVNSEHATARGSLFGRCVQATWLARRGRLPWACSLAREVMEAAGRSGPAYAGLACMAAVVLADALYELDDAEAAAQLLQPRIALLDRVSLPETMLRGCTVLADAHALAGRLPHALEAIDRLQAYAQRHALLRLQAEALLLRMRIHLRRGETERASSALDEVRALSAGRSALGPQMAQVLRATAVRAAAEMALMTRDFAGAFAQLGEIAPIAPIAPTAAGADATAEGVALHLRMALAAAAGERPASAALHLAEALRGGHRLGLVRTLLDALRLAPEAAQALLRTPVDDRLLALYLQRLAAAGAAGRSPAAAPAAAHPAAALLSEREREIAELLAQAMSNKRIAKVLDVSTETVKWHLKNVYAKLGVGGRGSAVARLRDLDRREPADA